MIFFSGCVSLNVARRTHDPILAGVGGLIFTLAVWLGWARWGAKIIQIAVVEVEGEALGQLGQLGDLFGGINALFASFAFIGVAVAAYFQYRTMRLVEEDSKLQREELKLQRQERTRQAFEPLFFLLLERVAPPADLFDSFGGSASAPTLIGKSDAAQRLGNMVKIQGVSRDVHVEALSHRYRDFYIDNEAKLGPHFRKLYHLFKFIHRSELSDEQKRDYATIARAALDKDDLMHLVVNTYTDEGKYFIPLIEYYGLLKHAGGSKECKQLAELNGIRECAFEGARARSAFWEQNPQIKSEIEGLLKSI